MNEAISRSFDYRHRRREIQIAVGLTSGVQFLHGLTHAESQFQMVFGVGPSGIYLTNPLESVSEALLSEQLCSESELLVRRADVLYRFDPATCDLAEIADLEDERWDEYNVLGQVRSIREVSTLNIRFNFQIF